jgi:hypothetical protein
MESIPDNEHIVHVYEAPNGVLNVIIRTIDDEELERLRESRRQPAKRAHRRVRVQ